MPRGPTYLRFAQALALVSGLGSCAPTPETAPTPAATAGGRTTGTEITASDPCGQCVCGTWPTLPSCSAIGAYERCCLVHGARGGPLWPPDLPA